LVCVCVYSVYVVLCLGRGLAMSWSPVQGVLPSVKWSRNWEISLMLQSGRKRRKNAKVMTSLIPNPSLRHQTGTLLLHTHAYQNHEHSTWISDTVENKKVNGGNSITIITGWMAGVRIPVATRDFSLLHNVHTDFWAHVAAGALSPVIKRPLTFI
jgi:hypothetical protein